MNSLEVAAGVAMPSNKSQRTVNKKRIIKSLLRTSFGSVGVYDLNRHRVLYAQWRVLKRLGYSRDEYDAVSRNFFRAILHPGDVPRVKEHLRCLRTAKPGTVLRLLMRLRDKEGNYHLIAMRDSALPPRSGKVRQVIGSLADVTPYSMLKDSVKDYKAMMDDLAFRTSHELRAPVATLLGLLSLIKLDFQTHNIHPNLIAAFEQTVHNMDKTIHDFSAALENIDKQ